MSKFEYCTHKLEMPTYKSFTCPPQNCPDEDALVHKHKEFGNKMSFTKTWGT